MITIFAIPKPFQGHINIIQRNAIQSWKKTQPDCQIILLGNDLGVAEIAKEFNLAHILEIKKNELGTPLINDIFEKVEQMAKNNILAYVNADIILLDSFERAIKDVKKDKFLIVGQRTDINISEKINFSENDWREKLLEKAKKEGILHGPAGIDYFIFSKNFWQNIPAFALGRTCWDNWFLYSASLCAGQIVDATKIITILHQNHDYSHHPAGKKGVWKGQEAEINLKLAGGLGNLFTIRDVDLIITKTGKLIKPKVTFYRFFSFSFRYFKRVSLIFKAFLFPGWLMMIIWRKIRQKF